MDSKTDYIIGIVIFILGFFATYAYVKIKAVNPTNGFVACSMEAKICPDGSSVGRTGPNCEFTPCGTTPVENNNEGNIETSGTGSVLPSSGGTEGGGVACTMEAKICPDGSAVGRTGPNCEFSECPIVGAQGSMCARNSDCVTGYECIDASPVVREGTENLRCWKIGAPHPICLSGYTHIGTPDGDVLVKDMKTGMSVWTIDKNGKKVSETVLLTGKTLVSSTHKVMHIKLSDGQELFVSLGHKIADGRSAGKIILGDMIDGLKVVLADLVPYKEEYTYDILPGGETGMYFANGILLQSTLK